METIQSLDDIADLTVFVHVVETQGFSAAARLLGLTKSAVSKKINRLEERLGLRLLQRTTRRMALTEAGRLVFERAAPAVALLGEARQLASGLVEAPRGTLRVTASVTFGKLCLMPLLPEFLACYPEINVQLSLLDRFVDLVDEGYDLALRLTQKPPDNVVAKALMPISYRLCAAVDYVKGRKIESPADLVGLNGLSYYDQPANTDEWRFTRAGQEERVKINSRLQVNNSEVVRDLLLAGLGVGLVWNYAVDREIAAKTLLPLLPEWTPVGPFGQTAYALWLPQSHLPLKVRVFVDYLVEKLRPAV